MNPDRQVLWLMRIDAGVLLLALPCSLLPFAWMNDVHREALGLGPLPDAAITRYMARSLSLVYGMHGVVILYVILHWERCRQMVPFLATLHFALGAAIFAVDLDAILPWWWTAVEGPGLMAYALLTLAVFRRAERARIATPGEPGV
jgi:hypothetical protein